METGLKEDVVGGLNPAKMLESAKGIAGAGLDLALGGAAARRGGAPPQRSLDRIEAIAQGAKEIGSAAIGQRGPEAFGRVLAGTVLPSAMGYGISRLGRAGAIPATRALRRRNLERAINADDAAVMAIEREADALDPPLAMTTPSLERKLRARRELLGAEVGRQRAGLGDTGELSGRSIRDALDEAKGLKVRKDPDVDLPERVEYVEHPELDPISPPVEEIVRPAERVAGKVRPSSPLGDEGRAIGGVQRRIEKAETGPTAEAGEGFVDIDQLEDIRRGLDDIAYAGTGVKDAAGFPQSAARVSAAKVGAGQIRKAMQEAAEAEAAMAKKMGTEPVLAKYLAAKREAHLADILHDPVAKSVTKVRSAAAQGKGSHGFELAGRAFVGGGLGGAAAGMLGAAGGPISAATATGALAALALNKFFHSAAWNTLGAKTKLGLLRMLENRGYQAFQDAAASALMAESTRRKRAESELQNQGKGVVGP
jgi:hypothetical protein